jgi:acyl-CoA thioester hydrolase
MADGPPAPEGYVHFTDVRVRFAETDAQAVVYHANFLVYCEQARIEYWRAMYGGDTWRDDRTFDFVLAHVECDYRAPARFDDRLRIFARVARVGRSSLEFHYRVAKWDGTVVCNARTVQVSIDPVARTPIALPVELVDRIKLFEAT